MEEQDEEEIIIIIISKSVALKSNRNIKLKWLYQNSLLPLPPHQCKGSCYVRSKCIINCVNRKTGKETTCIRSRINLLVGDDGDGDGDGDNHDEDGSFCGDTTVIDLFKRDALFPPDENSLAS
jgi:hypothetical protein